MGTEEFKLLYQAWLIVLDVDRVPLTHGQCGTLYLLDQLLQSAMKQDQPVEVAAAARELGIEYRHLLAWAADIRPPGRPLPGYHYAWGRAICALHALIP